MIMTADTQVSIDVTLSRNATTKAWPRTEYFLMQAAKMLEASLMQKMQGSFGVSHIDACCRWDNAAHDGSLLVQKFRSHNLASSVPQDICKDSKSQQLLQQEVHRFIADRHSRVHEQDLVSLQVGRSASPMWLAVSGGCATC